MDDICVPYGKWLQAGYLMLRSVHGKPRDTGVNGKWKMEASAFSPGLGHNSGVEG